MKNKKKSIITVFLAFLMISAASPMFLNEANAVSDGEPLNVSYGLYRNNKWRRIETDLITILFPAGGKKPMFLWWYSNDTNNIYVVKFKGLIEYLTIDYPYYLRRYQADGLTIRERLEAKYALAGPHQNQIRNRIYGYLNWLLDLHPAYLPFSACQWNLTEPSNVTREDGTSYITFNFTLSTPPPKFEFAKDNVIIRCRFYTTDATENVYGLYNYTVNAGELKMDLIIKNWKWNIDKINGLFNILHDEYGITVPQVRAGLALWVDLASIEIVDMPIADQDASSTYDAIEPNSRASDMIVGGQRVQVRENLTAQGTDETPMTIRDRIRERYRLRFAKGSQTLAGFFDFVDQAVIINSTTQETTPVNVTATYIPAGHHMRVFIGYPYFGSNILEHDPSIGVENVVPWMPTNLLMILIGATIIIAVAVAAMKLRKKPVNIVNVH
ncbi:MAG: hypothetical protein QHH18_05750 [Candidatus Bathyarchaeota archaeon]|nr:hypothetical protein [Candidatus Bathyarchaeota archaeon A05DMB-5]MDH7558092.1 hypothetical protein [Candidatus Bathyarchaeota archaeon]